MKKIISEITNVILDRIDMSEYLKINDVEHQNYYKSQSSSEHYRLLKYLSTKVDDSIIIDIGTFKGCSSLALSSNKKNKVYSFNLFDQLSLNEIPDNISFILDDVMNDQYKDIILKSKIILLDTFHDGTFEKEFFNYLEDINYTGTLLLDDINLNKNMIEFWNSIDYDKDDITHIGHSSGTGSVYFEKK